MAKQNSLNIKPGVVVSYQGGNYTIERIIDLSSILIKSTLNGKLLRVSIHEVTTPLEIDKSNPERERDLQSIPEKDWEVAQKRFSIIKPIIENSLSGGDIVQLAEDNGLNYSTVYRWLRKYIEGGENIIALLNDGTKGGKGIGRLSPEVEQIISLAIETTYLTNQRKPVESTYKEVCVQCQNLGVETPHINTVRNRIKSIIEEVSLKRRYGKDVARYKYGPNKGKFPHVSFPLEVVQIDHTKLDIILVDETHRLPVGRPWITVAIDVFSRMVVGLYLSFDPPGALAAGMCMSISILPKELYLNRLGVNEEWPCWGVMRCIHLDNGKEFRGHMLEKACENYNIEIKWRPVKTPHWGGHIERLLGTLGKEIHTLPGTTFSNTQERKGYDSEKQASLTLKELESWIITFITSVYHKRIHSSINMSPLEKYKEGIFGTANLPGLGLPTRIFNERKVRLDFMPFEERSVQEYGVQIDHINYYDDVLRRWIHAKEGTEQRAQKKKKLIFRRDPRNLGVIYFFDPELEEYFEIPYRNTSLPPITLWEYKEVVRRLKGSGNKKINETIIFEAYKRLKEIENEAVAKTAATKRRIKASKKASSQERSLVKEFPKPLPSTNITPLSQINTIDIKPFEDIDDGSPYS